MGVSPLQSSLLKKCATGSASAENVTISRHWQSQWHTYFFKYHFFNSLISPRGIVTGSGPYRT